uniref:LRIM1/APL1C-like dimerization domain-containing protein n=1 Tax=Anopheles dirus TaxID=7168 RepID=A0A1Y9H355_9DIPT
MAGLRTVTLISLLLAYSVTHGQESDTSANNGAETTQPKEGSQSNKRHPGPSFMCQESVQNYDCIFHDVHITRDTPTVYFGFADVAMNNQTKITFKNSHMRVLPQPLLGSFQQVELFDGTGLQMDKILPSAFQHGGSIKELYLSFNNIQSLTQNTFYHLKSLEYLTIDRNNLSSLVIGVFAGTPKLKVLSLSNNNLDRIEDGTFNWTISLEYLNLASNKLTHIDLSLIPSLNTANVSYNQLTVLSVPAEIETLDASHNQISSVSGQNNELVRLNLGHNNLTGIAWLVNFPSMQELDLSYNELQEISAKHLINARNLSILLLQHNRLMRLHLPKTLPNLRVLDVSHNSLLYVENNQQQFGTLEQLYLDHNSIVTIKMFPNNTVQNLTMSHNDWDCKNLREYNHLMGKVNDVERNCKDGYALLNGLCCKETDKPYLDRLNEQIKATSFAEKSQRADGRCSAKSALADALSAASFAKESEAKLESHRSHQTDIIRLEKENQQLKNAVQRDNMIFLGLHDAIDANIRRYRVSKEGLVNESVNLGKVFKHLGNRHEFKKKESKDRWLEANGKLNETNRLGQENQALKKKIEDKNKNKKELQSKTPAQRNKVKLMEKQKHGNARTQQISG